MMARDDAEFESRLCPQKNAAGRGVVQGEVACKLQLVVSESGGEKSRQG